LNWPLPIKTSGASGNTGLLDLPPSITPLGLKTKELSKTSWGMLCKHAKCPSGALLQDIASNNLDYYNY